MAFDVTLEMVKGTIAKITLSGELDASVAAQFKAKVEEAAAQKAKRLVLMLQDLSYIASAGIRVLIFAKQKMGSGVDIFVVAPQEQVMETLEMTGLQYSVEVLDVYDAEKIETL
ncbi:anti-sigma factor antagonist [Candidatus Vecturithrix granuli]|uniref:Anti-sigma factor antagonist n=1 Tax=Vecturithrix granuli TaxID=1499967 RepID=A0A0S6W711_VECG1|nr:anti-sigma factor antagonist [Candidatus Vecturithrix granuli]